MAQFTTAASINANGATVFAPLSNPSVRVNVVLYVETFDIIIPGVTSPPAGAYAAIYTATDATTPFQGIGAVYVGTNAQTDHNVYPDPIFIPSNLWLICASVNLPTGCNPTFFVKGYLG